MIQVRIRPWLVAVGFVALAAIHSLVVMQRQPAAELAIKLQSCVPSYAQAYFDTGSGFNENESSIKIVSALPGEQQLFFPLPTKTIYSIRFDPLQASGSIEIRDAFIQRPRTGALLQRFDLSKTAPGNEITSVVFHDGNLEITTAGQATESQLILACSQPLLFRHSAQQIFSTRFFRLIGKWMLFGILLLLANYLRRRWWPRASRLLLPIDQTLTNWSRPFASSSVFPLDRIALCYYALCVTLFATMAIAGLHGSAISLYGSGSSFSSVVKAPLVGLPKVVRVDEWNYHTPTILNQILRRDRFETESSLFGPDKAALFGNVPTNHWTEWFRPQFWLFHCLPPAAAFACYWQTKGLLLLTGTFSLLLLLTRSSVAAALGALWYFFSAYTQWSYSWPTLLPEMVGLFGWVLCFGAYLTIGRSRWKLLLATILCVLCAVDFAFCIYPPHQFPLVIFGLGIVGWWIVAHAGKIFCKEQWLARSLAVAGCCLSIGLVIGLFYFDTQKAFGELARTIYPGQRSVGGGSVSTAQMLSHFMDFWKSEAHFPLDLANICEGTGYLWLAPATLLMPWPAITPRRIKLANAFLWFAFLVLAVWMLLPVPVTFAKLFLMDKAPPQRCLHALGLLNIAIVMTYVSTMQPARARRGSSLWKQSLAPFIGLLLLLLITLGCMNSVYGHFFTSFEIAMGSAYTAFLILCLRQSWKRLLAAALLLPAVASYSLVNPVDRGLNVITKSSLAKMIKLHPEVRNGRWLAFSSWIVLPGFISASGVDLVNGLRIIPAFDELSLFDPEKKYASVINRSCYLVAHVQTETEPSQFETPQSGVVDWKVNPLDPRLRELGVKYLAFDLQPDESIRRHLKPLLEEKGTSLWIYELL